MDYYDLLEKFSYHLSEQPFLYPEVIQETDYEGRVHKVVVRDRASYFVDSVYLDDGRINGFGSLFDEFRSFCE